MDEIYEWKYWAINPKTIKKNQYFFVLKNKNFFKYLALENPKVINEICEISAKDELGNNELLKFNLLVESNVYTAKLNSEWI